MAKKISLFLLLATSVILAAALCASAWEPQGRIFGTELEFSDLKVTKTGVNVRLTNTTHTDVEVSLKLVFYDRQGNTIGYSLFGLREIPGETYVNISNNFLNGNWKQCRDAQRMVWEKMTYELLY